MGQGDGKGSPVAQTPAPGPSDVLDRKAALDALSQVTETIKNQASQPKVEGMILVELQKQTQILQQQYAVLYGVAKKLGGL
jgi:hypothetical protein